jgi:hypothetical protein
VATAANEVGLQATGSIDVRLQAELPLISGNPAWPRINKGFDNIAAMAATGEPTDSWRNKEEHMTIQRMIRIIAGTFILLSLYLSYRYNGVNLSEPTWLWFTAFVGANLLQSGFTQWCLMETILSKLGLKKG